MSDATTPPAQAPVAGRVAMGLLGLAGGAAAWALLDLVPDALRDAPRGLLFLRSLAACFFAAALALAGPLRPWRALAGAAALALPLAGLMTWASLRFDTVGAYLQSDHPVVGLALLCGLALPFLIAGLGRGSRWFDYPVLFEQSWMIVVRFAAAWLFVGLVWAVLFLSNALLNLVGLDLIQRLIEREVVVYLLTGLTLGLALAVMWEFSDYISPDLLLFLLRLLLPVVLAVVVVFLVALPVRGLSQLFGGFSAGRVLLVIALGATMLVSSGLDTGGADRPVGRVARWCCLCLALLLPALAGLALYAIWLRVAEYGLTPDRIVALALAGLALAYGIAYALSVLAGRGWAARIRVANMVMAVVVLATVAAFFTPLLNPQKLAAENQIARFASGRTGAAALDLWTIAHDWGVDGKAALTRLAALTGHPQADVMAERLAALEVAESRHAFEDREEAGDAALLRAEIAAALPVRPEGAALPDGLLAALRLWELQQIAEGCAWRTAAGNRGCVALRADLSEARAGDEVLIVAQAAGGAPFVRAYFREVDGPGDGARFSMRSPDYLSGGAILRTAEPLIDALMTGRYGLAPLRLNVLRADGRSLFFGR